MTWADVWGPNSRWFWAMIQAFAIPISLTFVYRQLRLNHFKNMLDTLARIDEQWRSERILNSRISICQSFINPPAVNHKSITFQEAPIMGFFEDIGLFCKLKVLDKGVIWESYSQAIEYYWHISEPRVKEFRSSTSDNTWYSNFEYLYHEMVKVSKRKKAQAPEKSDAALKIYAQAEVVQIETYQHHDDELVQLLKKGIRSS